MENDDRLKKVIAELEQLQVQNESFSKKIEELRLQINLLKAQEIDDEKIDEPSEELTVQQPIIKAQAEEPFTPPLPKKLYRSTKQKVLAGVCAGVADYLNINRFLVRFIFLLATLLNGLGAIVYVILWIAAKKEPRSDSLSPSEVYRPMAVRNENVSAPPPTSATSKTSPEWSMNRSNLEKFIGEKIISIIGISITVIGVGIGAKYSIEHNLISPLTRIILGYLVGVGLLFFGIRLKQKFENFSAVLVSGAMAIFYFITFAAYSFYNLFPQELAFGLMVVFTAFTVVAALNYNQQVIALIGLVGAYAVPFLLSDGSGRVEIMFSYMALVNVGILIIAFKKYWKPLYYSAFGLTWIIYASWYNTSYHDELHFTLALVFAAIFFITFYITFLAYKFRKKEVFGVEDVILLLVNSFAFFGAGYAILDSTIASQPYLGLFTLLNAIVHFAVSATIYKKDLGDKNLFYLITGLVLVFITIAIPIQLSGNWVTLLWIGEAALLFWIGRTKNVPFYEILAYAAILLGSGSLVQDWSLAYGSSMYSGIFEWDAYSYSYMEVEHLSPILNISFLSSALFAVALWIIHRINANSQFEPAFKKYPEVVQLVQYALPALLIASVFMAFRLELTHYFNQLYSESKVTLIVAAEYDYEDSFFNFDILLFKKIATLIYCISFLFIIYVSNVIRLKNKSLGIANIILNSVFTLLFLTIGLYALSELRESFINQEFGEYYKITNLNVAIRYVSLGFLGLLLFATRSYLKQHFLEANRNLKIAFEALLNVSILWVASSEFISIMDLTGTHQSYKLGLSILWGVYSLILISVGIWKHRSYLRYGAIALFAITLIKLFFYDISHLTTIAKTVVFVSLGILLLIISFLYNKFKNQIGEDIEETN